jgi:hypothetical protein
VAVVRLQVVLPLQKHPVLVAGYVSFQVIHVRGGQGVLLIPKEPAGQFRPARGLQ